MRIAFAWTSPPHGLEDSFLTIRNLSDDNEHIGEAFISHHATNYAWDISLQEGLDSWSSCGAEPTIDAAKHAVDEWLESNGFILVTNRLSIVA